MKRHDVVILHTMVGSLDGTDTYFRSGGYGGTESHFGVGGEGRSYQWQDTDYQAEANLAANYRAISIETEDRNSKFFPTWNSNDGSAVPAWTDRQIEEIARIVAWCCTVHNIPCQLAHDSKPGTRGIAYHRLGVDGNFPDHRVTGGEVWSSATGKVCPGNRRIAQIPKVIEKARRIMGGVSAQPEPLIESKKTGGIVIPVLLPRTDAPEKADSPSSTWPYREEVIDLGYVGGWRGRCYVRLSFGHPGGQVLRAHFDTSIAGKAAVFNVPGVGEWPGQFVDPAYANGNRWTIEAPTGPTALMLTYAAPGGASLSIEWER
jgi:hypothetical protein